ncbi:MAG: hypothetical protein ABIJ96_03065 [Elusimicrobiota bacterium]
MPDPELVEYLKNNLPLHGEPALRAQLAKDGVSEKDIAEAIAAAHSGDAAAEAKRRHKKRLALIAVTAGVVLVALAVSLSIKKPPPPPDKTTAADIGDIDIEDGASEGEVFRGHYGFMFKLPPKYQAHSLFLDPKKTHERVYIYPKGTNPQHFIHEGLFGSIGILRLDVMRRRVPQGFVGIDTLKSWVTAHLDSDKASYQMRDLMVHSKPAFIINTEKPFRSAKAYIIGQKVRYELTGGEENTIFTSVLSSLYEASPHDRPGN